MADIKYIITADEKGAVKSIESVNKSIGGMKTQATTSSSALSGLWKKLTIGTIAIAGVVKGYRSFVNLIGDSIRLAIEQEQVEAKLNAVLESTKRVAGLTNEELLKMAGGFQKVTTYGDEAIIGVQSLLLTFTKIGKDVFPEALEVILDMSTALGQDTKSSAIQLGKALNDPITGVTALRRVGVMLTEQQQEQIKTLVEHGKLQEAQKIILTELKTEFGGTARAMTETYGGALQQVKNIWGDVKEEIGGALTQNEDFIKLLHDVRDELTEFIESGKAQQFASDISLHLSAMAELGRGTKNVMQKVDEALADAGNWIKNLFKKQEELRVGTGDFILTEEGMIHVTQMAEHGFTRLNGVWAKTEEKTDDVSNKIIEKLNPALLDADGKVKTLSNTIETDLWKQFENLQLAELDTAKYAQYFVDTTTDGMEEVFASLGILTVKALETNEDIKEVAIQQKSIWSDVADGIKTNWISEFSEMLQGVQTWSDGFKAVTGHVKKIFFDLLAEMLTKFMLTFVAGILKGGKDILGGLKSTFSGIGSLFSSIFGGGGAPTGGAGGVVGAVTGFTPAGIGGSIVTGLISGLGGFLGGIFGGKGKQQIQQGRDMIWWLKTIQYHIEQGTNKTLYAIKDETLGGFYPKYDSMLAELYEIRDATKGTYKSLTHKGTVFVDIQRARPFDENIESLKKLISYDQQKMRDQIGQMTNKLDSGINQMSNKLHGELSKISQKDFSPTINLDGKKIAQGIAPKMTEEYRRGHAKQDVESLIRTEI